VHYTIEAHTTPYSMTSELQRAGISGYTIRLAAHYACLGVGTYQPKGYAQIDTVQVYMKMPWVSNEQFTQSCLILAVGFFYEGRQMKEIEFALTPAGFTGVPVVQRVS